MKISKLIIENLYGISQLELDDKSIQLEGNNGVGKSSVLDAIKLALTNSSPRKYVVKKGEQEGRIYIKLDNGITIDRKKRIDKSDYKSVKDENGNEINSPETFLKDIFTPLQLNPVEFLNMSEKEQNKLLLDLIEFNENKEEYIKAKFGEIPSGVDMSESILEILNEIQDKDGKYYQDREEINRNIRNANAIVNDIAKDIPENYEYDKWKTYTLSDKYEELNKIKDYNEKIDRSIAYKENYNNTINGLKGKLDSDLASINSLKQTKRKALEENISELKIHLALLEKDLNNLDNEYLVNETEAKAEYDKEVAKLEENIKVANEWASKEKQPTEQLENDLKIAEEMKGHINEYERMLEMRNNIEQLSQQSQALTDKIELARNLPGEILKTAKIPVKDLTVENGIPLVKGLPINNLSEGQKLMLCVDVTLNNSNNLKLILIDGVEKLSDTNRDELYKICREKGLQIIATKTNNSSDLKIIEL